MSIEHARRRTKPRREILPAPSSEWSYFLDFDGTLVELAPTPTGVHADPSIHAIVMHLAQSTDGALAIISGRTIAELDAMFGLPGLPIAGQHGLERRSSRGAAWRLPISTASLNGAREVLARAVQRFPSLLIEDKGVSLALHYRAAPLLASYAHQVMRIAKARTADDFVVQGGKRVVELIPACASKGAAVAAFLDEAPFHGRRPVFIGDDQSDESGFRMVNSRGGISVKVGPGRTSARWTLPDVSAVRAWLSGDGHALASSGASRLEAVRADA